MDRDGWIKAGIKVPVNLTVRQVKYATRCTGIALSVFNLMVGTQENCATQSGSALWGFHT